MSCENCLPEELIDIKNHDILSGPYSSQQECLDNHAVSTGTQINVSSIGNKVNMVFDQVTMPGSISFTEAVSDDNKIILYDIDSSATFQGDIVLSFSSPDINVAKNPILFHIIYDEQSNKTIYENITTQVSDGIIYGTTSSLSPFAIMTDTIGLDFGIGQFNPNLVLSGCSSPTGPTVDTNLPCTGGKTKGSWVVDENGIPVPKIFATKCDCYEPHPYLNVETIVGGAALIGSGAAPLCAGIASIRSLGIPALKASMANIRNLIPATMASIQTITNKIIDIDDIIKIGTSMRNVIETEIDILKNEIKDIASGIVDVVEDLVGGRMNIDFDDPLGWILDDDSTNYLEQAQEMYDDWASDLLSDVDTETAAALRRFGEYRSQYDTKFNDLGERGQQSTMLLKELIEKNKEKMDEVVKKTAIETELDGAEQLLKQQALELAQKEQTKSSLVQSMMSNIAGTLLAVGSLYNNINQIDIKKTCPEGFTLNPETCDCCPNCINGKILDTNSCDCICPENLFPCGDSCCDSTTTTTTPQPGCGDNLRITWKDVTINTDWKYLGWNGPYRACIGDGVQCYTVAPSAYRLIKQSCGGWIISLSHTNSTTCTSDKGIKGGFRVMIYQGPYSNPTSILYRKTWGWCTYVNTDGSCSDSNPMAPPIKGSLPLYEVGTTIVNLELADETCRNILNEYIQSAPQATME